MGGSQELDTRPDGNIAFKLYVGSGIEDDTDVDEDAVVHRHVVPAHKADVREHPGGADIDPGPSEQADTGAVEKIGLAATRLSQLSFAGLISWVSGRSAVGRRLEPSIPAVLSFAGFASGCPAG